MSRIAFGVLMLLLLELGSDVFIILRLGGWSLLVLPFAIFLQIVFDFILLAMVGFASYSRKTRVIQ